MAGFKKRFFAGTLAGFMVFAGLFCDINSSGSFSWQNYSSKASAAGAEKTYATSRDGTNVIEIGIDSDNVISLQSEKINYDFSAITEVLGDEVNCEIKRTYVLTNTSSKEVYVPIAVPELLKVEQVTVDDENKADFSSGCTIQVDGIEEEGLIYAASTVKKLKSTGIYDDFTDVLKHVDYSGYFTEAFTMYGITSETTSNTSGISSIGEIPESESKTYYQVSEEGEPTLCMVVYNLKFSANETHILHIQDTQTGDMSRPTKYSADGTTYTYELIGSNLNTFYNVGDIQITFTLPENNLLPILETSASRYLNDDVWTVHYVGEGKDFSVKLGTEITEDEINDINAESEVGRKFYNIISILGSFIIGASITFVIYTFRKRKQSGIGLDLKI
jgi:hypothetical protein